MATKLRSINDFLKYFESLAASYKEIQHNPTASKYFTDLETYLLGNGTSGYHIIANTIQSRLIDNKSDNVIRPVTVELWIVKPCAANSSEIIQTQDKCERIALDLVSRMRHDVELYPNSRTFDYFNTNGVNIELIGPIGNNCYGVALRVELGSSEPIINYDTTLWA
jgi:hypothetical protein